ncbi:hypothetical protein MGWOODY_Mmi1122 [hydrothermal vent metagenome]|uniref:Uncharacterized protein n=1 Tax=hydrothermal vent metagenome TaxID=652676 RepID=A0A160VE10_9ZZZZ
MSFVMYVVLGVVSRSEVTATAKPSSAKILSISMFSFWQ